MTRSKLRAALLAAQLVGMAALAAPAPAAAMQVLDAADHAELAAEISASGVNRIALHGDRIAKVVRAPDGFAVEHDAATGDLYLRPAVSGGAGTLAGGPVTLFIGTERGFTYRLTLTPSARESAQVLIRNADAAPAGASVRAAAAGDAHVAALVRLVRAVARREPLPGHAIEAGGGAGLRAAARGLALIETWRGPRFSALVFEAGRSAPGGADAAAGLAGTIAGLPGVSRVAALWLAAPGTGPAGGRLAVAVVETAAPGAPR